jgi:hypothetical protein
MVISPTHLRCAAAAAVGFALATAHPLGIASAILMPALALSQLSRRASYAAALSYYGAALWPIIPGARNFFGPDASALAAIALWVFAAATLGAVWPLLWSSDRRQAAWRSPLGLLLTVIPLVGIIGFASPLTATGFLFPRTSWCGLFACAVLSGALAGWPRKAGFALASLAVGANALYFRDPEPLPGWQGVNTSFGAIAHGRVNPLTDYQVAQWIQQFSLATSAKVIVFPETVVPTWTAATEAFWQQTLDRLRASGKTILVGTRLPIDRQRHVEAAYDFSADLVALRGGRPAPFPFGRRFHTRSAEFAYDNAVVVRGTETATVVQRIPVPIAMWNPFRSQSARLNLFAPIVVPIAGERAAVLVCYEQLLTWPVLTSVLRNPTVLVAVANDHWATGTPIPAFQVTAVRSWSRLFGIPAINAMNQ